jgi:hypothetical protein
MGSIEYGVGVLGAPLIVVWGTSAAARSPRRPRSWRRMRASREASGGWLSRSSPPR